MTPEELPDHARRPSRTRTLRRWLAAALVTLPFAALVAHRTSADEVIARLRAIPPGALLSAVLALTTAGVVRAIRLQLLLPRRLGLADAYAFNQTYNVVTATVPTGLGEAASAWLLRRTLHVPLHLGFVALFVTRLLDVLVLLSLFLMVVMGGFVQLGDASGTVVVAAAGLLALLAALTVLQLAGRDYAASWLEDTARGITSDVALRRALRRGLILGAESLRLLPTGRVALQLVGLTVLMQLVSLQALRSLLGGAGVPIGLATALVCFVIYMLLRMLPVQGIAGIGTTATWWAIALTMLGVPTQEAATLGAVLYVAFYVLLVALCVTSLPLLLFRRREG